MVTKYVMHLKKEKKLKKSVDIYLSLQYNLLVIL